MILEHLLVLLGVGNGVVASLPAFVVALSQSASAALATAIWQGTVVAGCLAVCLKIAPRATASMRFGIWSAGFLVVVVLPFLPVLAHLPASVATDPAHPEGMAQQPLLQLDLRWSIAIATLWAFASLFRAAQFALNLARLRQLWKTAIPVASRITVNGKLPHRKEIELCTTRDLERPSVIGFLAPRILIPEWLMPLLKQEELDQIVLHETEHLRRGDDWTNLLQKLSLILFPLNPVLLWMERRLCLEREMACDDGVVRATHAPRAYAACLTNLAEKGLRHRTHTLEALSLGAWQRRPELVQRVQSLLWRGAVLGTVGTRSLAALLVAFLVFGSVELSKCPQMIAFVAAPRQGSSLAARQASANPESEHPGAIEVAANGKVTPITIASGRPDLASTRLRGPETPSRDPSRQKIINQEIVNWPGAEARAAAAQQAMLGTDTPGGLPIQETGTGFIVLTAWEEEVVPGAHAELAVGPVSDQLSDQVSERPAGQPGAQPPTQAGYSRTVTRLVFRFVPGRIVTADSFSRSPVAVPTRNGWLVLQL